MASATGSTRPISPSCRPKRSRSGSFWWCGPRPARSNPTAHPTSAPVQGRGGTGYASAPRPSMPNGAVTLLRGLIQQTARVPWDDRRAHDAQVGDLRETKVREYLRDVESGLLDEPDERAVYRRMRLTMRVNDHEAPRNAGLLFFARDPVEWVSGGEDRGRPVRRGPGRGRPGGAHLPRRARRPASRLPELSREPLDVPFAEAARPEPGPRLGQLSNAGASRNPRQRRLSPRLRHRPARAHQGLSLPEPGPDHQLSRTGAGNRSPAPAAKRGGRSRPRPATAVSGSS